MIRIYLDWNVISNLKTPQYKEISDFIDVHKAYLQFPYSPAHFTDLMKSYSPENQYFEKDLDTLENLSGKHFLRWGKDGIEPLFGTPKQYFDHEKEQENIFDLLDIEKVFEDLDDSTNDLGIGKVGELMKSLYSLQPSGVDITEENRDMMKKMFPNLKSNSSMWDLMKEVGPFTQKLLSNREYYKDLRNSMADYGFRLDVNSGNWSYDQVVKNIDEFLHRSGTNMTFLEYVETSFKHKKEGTSHFEYYTTAYLMLDMLGYKSDKLPKPTDNMGNIQADGEHSFYGAHCDFLIASDKKLRVKSQVLYNEFNVNTKIIEPSDFISEIEKVIDKVDEKSNFLEEAFSFCQHDKLVEHYPADEEHSEETFAFKLPKFYFNYFNYMIYTNYPDQNGVVLTFRKAYKNFSRFIYFTESERLIDTLTDYFGYADKEELKKRKNDFVYGEEKVAFEWSFEGGVIKLEKEEDTKRPVLIYILSTKREKSD